MKSSKALVSLALLTLFCLFAAAAPNTARGAAPTDVSSFVSVTYSKVTTSYNLLTKVYTSTHTATLVNTSDKTLSMPLHGVLSFYGLTGTPTVVGASGGPASAPYYNYYYDLSGKVAGGSFAPGGSVSFTVTIQRKAGTSYSSTVITPFAVVPTSNAAPVADAGAAQNLTLRYGQLSVPVTLSGAGSSDPDGSIASWRWTGINGAPDPDDVRNPSLNLGVGAYTFALVVTDNQGAQSAPAQVSVTVSRAPNQAPTANAGEPRTINLQVGQASAAVTLNGAASSDPDGSIASWRWTGGADSPDPDDVSSPTVTLAPGLHTFTLVVTDNEGAQSAPAQVAVTVVKAPNQAPTADAGEPRSIPLPAGQMSATVTLSGAASSDLDGSVASYAWSAGEGTPDPDDVVNPTVSLPMGTHTFTLVVTDNEGLKSAPAQVVVKVVPPNAAPVLNPIGAKRVAEGSLLTFAVSGSDTDSSQLSFTAGALPAGASFSGATRTFAWTPGFLQAGEYQVTFSLSDEVSTVTETVAITVDNTNRPPVLEAVSDKTVAEDATLQFSLLATDPDGDALTFSATSLPGGASLDPASGVFSWRPGFSQAGNYRISFTVSDGSATAEKSASIAVTDVNRPPVIQTASLPAPKIDLPYPGVVAASDPDGDPLSFSLTGAPAAMTIGAASGAISWTPGASLMGENYRFTVAVSDGRGGSDSREYALTIPDSIAPAVTLNAPREVVPGASFTVNALASDNRAVASLSIDKGSVTCTALNACNSVIAVGQALAPGSSFTVVATALDEAGNTGSASSVIKIAAAPDTEPPTVTLSAPSYVTPGQTITISAGATDNQGVASLSFQASGAAIGDVAPPANAVSFQVPANAQIGSKIPFSVTAMDFSNLSAGAAAESEVVEAADTVPPVITLVAPERVVAGRTLQVTLKVTDDRGVSGVDLYLAHRKAASFQAAVDRVVELPVPIGTEAGTRLVVEASAVDASGNKSSARTAATVDVMLGVLSGAVYDDTSGAPLAGAEALLTVAGREPLTATTDAKGHYFFVANEGVGSVSVSKPGHSRVDRPGAVIVANEGRRVRDARLTPLNAGTGLSSILGGEFRASFGASGGGLTTALPAGHPAVGSLVLTVPAGALAADLQLSLTQVGAQGLQGVLPYGWSPAASFQVGPLAASFAPPANVTLSNLLALAPGRSCPLVKWDEGRGAWLGAGSATVAAAGDVLSAQVASAGQYAVLLADPGLELAAPAEGQELAGAASVSIPQEVVSSVLPQPKKIFYKPGVKSEVGTKLSAQAGLPSGTPIRVEIAESYRFFSGEVMAGEPFSQDIVLYRFGKDAPPVADYFVSPTLDLAGLALDLGTITVTQSAPAADTDLITIVGSAGGTFTLADGASLTVAPGAVTGFVPLALSGLDLAKNPVPIPAGLDYLGGIALGLAGNTLSLPAALSFPLPAGFTPTGDLALARAVEVNGETRLAFVASLVVENGRAVTRTDLLGTGLVKSSGIVSEGRYLLIDTRVRNGFAGGVVTGTDQAPFAGAVVSTSSLPLMALSGAGGKYVLPVAAGASSLIALDPVKQDLGSAQVTGVAGAYTPADLALKVEPPRVSATSPSATRTNVALADPVRITFSEPIQAASVKQQNFSLSSATGGVACTLELSGGNTVVTMRHATPLDPATVYTVTVSGVADAAGYLMAAPFTASFTSLDTNPPPAPPAANLAATIPSADGSTTVTGTQGSAGLHDTLYIVNLATGARTQVQVKPDGGFSTILSATPRDTLRLEITSPAGIITRVALPRFRQVNGDGSISEAVGPGGGRVLGPEGTAVDVPAGAFAEGAVITVKPVHEADFPVQLSEADRVNFSYSGGFKLDFGGAVPARYVNVSVPAGAGDTAEDQWVVTQVTEVNGRSFMAAIDTAKLIDSRIATASPPCPGVTAAGTFGMIKSASQQGVAYGSLGYNINVGSSVDIYSNGTTLPYSINLAGSYNYCVPIFSTNLTVAYNTVYVTVKGTDLSDALHEVVIKNNTSQTGSRFLADNLGYKFSITGVPTDFIRVVVKDLAGLESEIHGFAVSEGTAGKVDIAVPVWRIAVNQVSEVKIYNDSNLVLAPVAYAPAGIELALPVDGGMSDSYDVSQITTSGGNFPLVFGLRASGAGPGNLLVVANKGAITPTRLGGASHLNAIKVFQAPDYATPRLVVPMTSFIDGGFSATFNGLLTAEYVLELTYDDTVITQPFGKFSISLKDAQGTVIKSVSFPSPFKNMKLNVGTLNDKTGSPPVMSEVPLDLLRNFQPSKNDLTFTFSEPVNPVTVLPGNVSLKDSSGTSIPVELKLWQESVVVNGVPTLVQKLTVIPKGGMPAGQYFTLTMSGIKDLGGNLFSYTDSSGYVGPSVTYQIKTGSPALVKSIPLAAAGVDIPVNDLDLVSPATGESTVVATSDTISGTPGWRVGTFKVPVDSASADLSGTAFGGGYKRRVTTLHIPADAPLAIKDTVPGCSANIRGDSVNGYTFSGEMAVASSTVPAMQSWVSFYDVTNAASPCQLGGRLLTADPGYLSSYNSPGTYHVSAYAQGITTVREGSGYKALVAVGEFGLMTVDLGVNIPEEPYPAKRVKEPVFQGNYPEVRTSSDGQHLIVFDKDSAELQIMNMAFAGIGALKVVDPGTVPRFDYYGPVEMVSDNLSTLTRYDLVLVHHRASPLLKLVDIKDLTAPKLVGSVTLPGNVTGAGIDRVNRKIVVTTLNTVHVLDLNKLGVAANLPIVWKKEYTDRTLNCLKVDEKRGLFYVGTTKSLEVFDLLNVPNLTGVASYIRFLPKPDLGLDFNDPKKQRIRGAIVEMRDDATGALLDRTKTDADGYYSFRAPTGQDLRLVVQAAFTDRSDFIPRLTVRDPQNANAIYDKTEVTNCAPMTSCKVDILADQKWSISPAPAPDVNNVRPGNYAVREASPFAILDTVYTVESKVRQIDTGIVFPQLTFNFDRTKSNISAYQSATSSIGINGDVTADTDEYDTVIIGHEWFHYWQHNFARSDSPGGPHSAGEFSDQRLALNEGAATGFSSILVSDPRNNPDFKSYLYIDTRAGGVPDCGKACLGTSLKTGSAVHKGYYNENSIAELMWHLQDPKSPPQNVNLPFSAIYKAVKGQKSSKPFISIYSFIHTLADGYFADPSQAVAIGDPIKALFTDKGIDVSTANSDSYQQNDKVIYNPVSVTPSVPAAPAITAFTAAVGDASGRCGYAVGDPLQTCQNNAPQLWDPQHFFPADTVPNHLNHSFAYDTKPWGGNKLHEKLFFKFHVSAAEAGNYKISVNSLSAQPPATAWSFVNALSGGSAQWNVAFELMYNGEKFGGVPLRNHPYSPGSAVEDNVNLKEGDYSMAVSTRTWLGSQNIGAANQTDYYAFAPCRVSLTFEKK